MQGTVTLGATQGQGPAETKSAVIASGGTASTAFKTGGARTGSFQLPAAMTGTAVTVEGSLDGTNFTAVPVLAAGESNPVTVAANGSFALPEKSCSFPYLRFKSGSTEGADRTITYWLRG